MPPTTRATGTSTSAMPVTTSTPVNSAPTTTPPVPLPQRQSSTAPRFDSKAPSTLCTYLSDYESLAEAAQLTPGERLSQSTRYLTEEDKDDWENLPEFEASPPDWAAFKEALFREYPKARKPFISSADLGKFVNEKSRQEIHTLDDFAAFHREFRRLAKEKRVSADGLNRAYEKSIHPVLQDKILFYLSDEKTPCVKGEAFEVEHVREGAEHILEGFDHRYKHSRPSATPDSSASPPSAPPVKSEISEVLNAITMMGQNLQIVLSASQMASRPGPQGFSSQPTGQSDFSRQDRPRPGAAGNRCYMCQELAHFLNHCPVLLEYIRARKVIRNVQNMVMLSSGDPIPSDPTNRPWAAQIDEFYARNLQLLPRESTPHIQVNFMANFLEVKGTEQAKNDSSNLFAHLEPFNEEEEQLGSLGGEANPDWSQLGRYIEVLQARQNEMPSKKKQINILKSAPNQATHPTNASSAEKTYSAPKAQVPSSKPLPAAPAPSGPAVIPQFKYVAPVESNVDVAAVINRVLSENVHLSVEELLALAPEVRRHFKETTTTKRLPALPVEAMAAHTVSCYLMDVNHEQLSAESTLPLWTIEVTLDSAITVTGIIDSGCQVIIIRRDILERLGTPMEHEQVMFMESANGQSNMTMGTIPSICFSVGEVSLYCSVQVVKEVPFECLLGLPFTSLAYTQFQEFPDSSAHLSFTDPNTGASITVPMHPKAPSRCPRPHCSHEDF